MQIPLVMTIISPDRTGLVEAVARAVAEHGGNWLESRMCRLAALDKLQTNGLQIVVRDDAPVPAVEGRQTKLEIVGADRPGIVREITSALARAGVNVEEFSSEVASAPMSGETLFKAAARLRLPRRVEKGHGKNRRRFVGGCFVCRPGKSLGNPAWPAGGQTCAMRHLLQPRVLNLASVAALVSAVACYPRLSIWQHRPGPMWYSEAAIFVCCIMLWGFVFAWHTPYTKRPVFVFNLDAGWVAAATMAGLVMAAVYYLWLDPLIKSKFPEDYAPFDWLMRLAKNRWVAMTVTALLGAGVQALKIHKLAVPVSPLLLAALLALRVGGGILAVTFYLRGGIFLVWWWTFLLESRLLVDLIGGS